MSPIVWSRPEACQISIGRMAGISSSWPPAASISSRMMCSIVRRARQAEGEVGVDAGGELVDEAGAEQELVGGGLGLRRGLAQGLAEEL